MSILRALIPAPILSAYHFVWAYLSAWFYGHPSREMVVIGVTGTKGKSSVAEIVATLLRGSGHTVAVASTIHFVVGTEVERNLYKMTMPGRGRVQKFLRKAADAGCTHAVIEMTSEAVLQHRHYGIELNALVFTNLAPEHVERHGSYEAYIDAKLELARTLARSSKRPRTIVANADDAQGAKFLAVDADIKVPYSLSDAEPYSTDDRSVRFVWRGEVFAVPLPGLFNLYNCLAALSLGEALGMDMHAMKSALERMGKIAGRAERVERGQPFDVVVDYAHTMESLRALYETFKQKRIIAVIGATGGGRDARTRSLRGALAEEYAALTLITNEDPYDEDPQKILHELAAGFTRKKPLLLLDRRAAISKALEIALSVSKGLQPLDKTRGDQNGVAVLITGKGTDPYIMGPRGTKVPWNDRQVAEEELAKLGYN